jgi:Spy/CpxP family protein refolding chaperone
MARSGVNTRPEKVVFHNTVPYITGIATRTTRLRESCMRSFSLTLIGLGAFGALAISAGAAPTGAQAGQQQAAGACVSPLPMPLGAALGGRGAGRASRRPGCPPFFPDSLALSPAQQQQIVALRAAFRQSNAAPFARLTAISDSARAARAAGATPDQVRAIEDQARPIEKSLRPGNEQVQLKIEAVLTPGQLAWMRAFRSARGRGRGRGRGRRAAAGSSRVNFDGR